MVQGFVVGGKSESSADENNFLRPGPGMDAFGTYGKDLKRKGLPGLCKLAQLVFMLLAFQGPAQHMLKVAPIASWEGVQR